MGRVLVCAPVTKKLITTSSSDMAKASSDPDRMAGAISGRVMSKNIRISLAPRSRAASPIERSIPASRPLTTMKI